MLNIVFSIINFFIVLLLTKYFIYFSNKNNFFEAKNKFIKKRSKIPTAGGIIFISSFIILYLAALLLGQLNFDEINRPYLLPSILAILLATSFLDDRFGISSGLRFIIQSTVVFISLPLVAYNFEFLPYKLGLLIIVYFWLLTINTSNFIDGLDGMLSINVIFFCLQIFSIIFLQDKENTNQVLIFVTSLMLSSVLGFIIYNYPIAKLYMGDSGSIPLGYIIGFLIIQNLNLNDPYIIFFLFSYPITDVLTTIFIKTVIKKKLPWARLFDYFFLQPVIKYKKKHTYVTSKIIFINFVSLILLILYIKYQYKYLILINIAVNFSLLFLFNKKLSPKRISKIN